MKHALNLTAMALLAAAGCNATPPLDPAQRSAFNAWLGSSLHSSAVEAAIVTQHTIFPYHFVPNASTLNDLGRRDLDVLAAHYRDYPDRLNVQGGGVDPGLYAERVKTVVAALTEAGVQADHVKISAGFPGGDGMLSEQVLTILERQPTGSAPPPAEASGGMLGAGP